MTTRIYNKTICIISLLSLLASVPAWAMDSSECNDCHGDTDAVGEELMINPLTFDNTAHAELGCKSCHPSITDEPPDDGLEPVKASCSQCH